MKKAWEFFLENFDALIAIAVSLIAAIVGVFGSEGNQPILLGGISATLAVLSYSIIRDRRNRRVLESQLTVLQRSLPHHPSAIAFFRPMRDFDTRLKNARKIDLCGVSLTNTISAQFAAFRSRIEGGADFRVLIIDPNSHAIEMTSERSINPKDTMYYQRRLESTFSELTYLHKFAADMKGKGRKGFKTGSLFVKLLSYAPSFSIVSLDASDKDGLVQVEIFPHKFGFKARPVFTLSFDNDGEWYTYFVEQFEQMWKAAKPWDPTAYVQRIPFDDIASS